MANHPYRPDPDDYLSCLCGLPRNNRAHQVVDRHVPDISEARYPNEPAAQQHSPTSVQAAILLAPALKGAQARAAALIDNAGVGGLTDDELAVKFGDITGNTARPRRTELVRKGVVVGLMDHTGRQVTRRTRQGRDAAVWVIAAEHRGQFLSHLEDSS